MSVVEFAAVSLKPGILTSDAHFQSVWTSALANVSAAAGCRFQLWQETSDSSHLYLLGGWPDPDTHASFLQSESTELLKSLGPLIDMRFVQHVRAEYKDVPLQAPILAVETFSVEPENEGVWTEKARKAEERVAGATKPYRVAGGFDVKALKQPKFETAYKRVQEEIGTSGPNLMREIEEAKGSGTTQNKTWVSFSGWEDEEKHVVFAKEVAGPFEGERENLERVPGVFGVVHLKLLMG